MAAGDQDFNADFWIGMVTANPVLLVAFCTVFESGRDFLVGWSNGARRLWLAILRTWLSGVLVILAGLVAPSIVTLTAAQALYDHHADPTAARNSVWMLAAALASLLVVVMATAGPPQLKPIAPEKRPKWWLPDDASSSGAADGNRAAEIREATASQPASQTTATQAAMATVAVAIIAYLLGRTRKR